MSPKPILLYLLLSCLLFSGLLSAQTQTPDYRRCHTMPADAQLRERFPEMGDLQDLENWLAPRLRAYQQEGQARAVSVIPVVFHIIHNGETVGTGSNIAAAYINAQIEQLNNDFRRILGSSGHNTHPVGADAEIEFCPATVGPNGQLLNEAGINRIDRQSQGWPAPPFGECVNDNFDETFIEQTIKPQSQWDPDHYLNIWVMDISCGILGYAQFPSTSGLGGLGSNGGPAATDGVVLLYTSLGSTDLPFPGGGSFNQGRTATHEVGHFFGLRHIWGDAVCGDDFCADTPQANGPASGCPNKTSCDGIRDMVENYMDYSHDACMNIFTGDQKARMQTVLLNSPRRGSLTNSTACSTSGGGGLSCPLLVSSFPYTEGFEQGDGNWTASTANDFDWTRQTGPTPSSNTGPAGAAAGNWYFYAESSDPNYSNKTSLLTSPCFDLSGQGAAQFSFQYHMYGAAEMGSLSLQVKPNAGAWSTLWTQSGNQGPNWAAATVDLTTYAGDTLQLRFVAITGTTWQGDVAIDELSLTVSQGGACVDGITVYPYTEDWETDFGRWGQSTQDDLDWLRLSGSTPSSGTGPAAAASGNWYVYIESSDPNYPAKTAILNGPCFDLSNDTIATLAFEYHLYGAAGMGSLKLQVKAAGGNWQSLWSVSGNQGSAWLSAEINLDDYVGSSVEFRFVGTTGNTWQGDIAIDQLRLTTADSTSAGCTEVTVQITFDNYPEETSWQISDAAGAIVAAGGPYAAQADGSTLETVVCLPAGCYDFTILDSYGDGICCTYGNGSYSVQDAGGNILASGAAFGGSETTNFCLTASARQLPQQSRTHRPVALHAYPNPVADVLSIDYVSHSSSIVSLRLLDVVGNTVRSVEWTVEPGSNQQQLLLSDLSVGTYWLVLEEKGQRVTRRVVVVR